MILYKFIIKHIFFIDDELLVLSILHRIIRLNNCMQTTEFPSNISSQKTDTPKLSASVVNSGRQNKQIVHE